MKQPDSNAPQSPSFLKALSFWFKLGCVSFGGPASQIAIMHRELVERRAWVSDRQFFGGLNFCMVLPGPEAQQLATYLGWRLHGLWGGVVAGTLFVLPAAFILFALSWLYVMGDELPWIQALFHGLLGAVIAIIFDALLRIGKKALNSLSLVLMAISAFVAIYFFQVSFVIIILSAALLGMLGHALLPKQFAAGNPAPGTPLPLLERKRPSLATVALVSVIILLLWWTPILGLGLWLGWDNTHTQQGLFFSKASLVTFGGAYAVLPYVAQQAVEHYQWLEPTQMMAGLALAESTPGPLIMVLQFVGFVGGWQNPGEFTPLQAAILGSMITTWVTFLPCFLFVFLGAPWIDRIDQMPFVRAALTGITACVVGVILNLGIKFSAAALWPEQFDVFVAVVAVLAFGAIKRFRFPLIPVILISALAGVAWGIARANGAA